jgi:hypothetical protein
MATQCKPKPLAVIPTSCVRDGKRCVNYECLEEAGCLQNCEIFCVTGAGSGTPGFVRVADAKACSGFRAA